jgi:hypothetical protein
MRRRRELLRSLSSGALAFGLERRTGERWSACLRDQGRWSEVARGRGAKHTPGDQPCGDGPSRAAAQPLPSPAAAQPSRCSAEPHSSGRRPPNRRPSPLAAPSKQLSRALGRGQPDHPVRRVEPAAPRVHGRTMAVLTSFAGIRPFFRLLERPLRALDGRRNAVRVAFPPSLERRAKHANASRSSDAGVGGAARTVPPEQRQEQRNGQGENPTAHRTTTQYAQRPVPCKRLHHNFVSPSDDAPLFREVASLAAQARSRRRMTRARTQRFVLSKILSALPGTKPS